MKIYCYCNSCKIKIHLKTDAKTRQQLSVSISQVLSITCLHCQQTNQIHVNNVRAEATQNNKPLAGFCLGGLTGAVAGPLGMGIGAVLGGISGGTLWYNDNQNVNYFNNNYI